MTLRSPSNSASAPAEQCPEAGVFPRPSSVPPASLSPAAHPAPYLKRRPAGLPPHTLVTRPPPSQPPGLLPRGVYCTRASARKLTAGAPELTAPVPRPEPPSLTWGDTAPVPVPPPLPSSFSLRKGQHVPTRSDAPLTPCSGRWAVHAPQPSPLRPDPTRSLSLESGMAFSRGSEVQLLRSV